MRSVHDERVYALWNFADIHDIHQLQGFCVNHRYGSRSRVRIVDALTVWGKRNPFWHRSYGRMIRWLLGWQWTIPDQLKVGQRILEHSIGDGAVHPERFSIRGNADAVGRSPKPLLGAAEPAWVFRQNNTGNLFAACKIHDGEAIQAGELDKDPARRTVRVRLERHRTHAPIELKLPGGFLRVQVNHCRGFVLDRAADGVLAIRRDENIVHAAVDRNAFRAFERTRIDHIHGAGIFANSDEYPAAVLGDSQVIGVATERHFLHNFCGLSIHNIHDGFRFVADVDPFPIGRKGDAVGQFDAPNHLNHLVDRGIDYVHSISSAVGYINPGGHC